MIYGLGTAGMGRMRMPYGVGSFGHGAGSFGSGPLAYAPDKRQLTELMDNSLLSPEAFLGLPQSVQRVFGNYRNYASAWQMKRQGTEASEAAYLRATQGERVIPEAGMRGAMQARGGGRAVGKVEARPGVAVGMGGERMRIPEEAIGRDIGGELKFRIPEEKTAYKQQEIARQYEEAQFIPDLRQRAAEKKTAALKAERLLETEMRTADKDINATIERLLKSKDLKEVAEGRRLQSERDKLKEAEKKRGFTLERDESKRKHDMDKITERGIQRSAEIDQRYSNARALIAMRQDNAWEIYQQRRDDMRQMSGYRWDEKWANTEARWRMDLLEDATRASVRAGEAIQRQGMRVGDYAMIRAGERMIREAQETAATEHDRIMAEHKQKLADIKAGVTEPRGAGGRPSAGDVEDGYRFKGGNPADANNWELVK